MWPDGSAAQTGTEDLEHQWAAPSVLATTEGQRCWVLMLVDNGSNRVDALISKE